MVKRSTGGLPPMAAAGCPNPQLMPALRTQLVASWVARAGAPGRPPTSASTGPRAAATSGSQARKAGCTQTGTPAARAHTGV
jgi:hypothetical protein